MARMLRQFCQSTYRPPLGVNYNPLELIRRNAEPAQPLRPPEPANASAAVS
jgi:hypothetical protein